MSEYFVNNLFFSSAAYLTYSGSHYPSNNYMYYNGSTNLTFCPCDNPTCVSNRELVFHPSSSSCVYYVYNNTIYHTKYCLDCDFSKQESHNIIYTITHMKHTFHCVCGYDIDDYHTFRQIGIRSVCTVCGYSTTGPIIVPINGGGSDDS